MVVVVARKRSVIGLSGSEPYHCNCTSAPLGLRVFHIHELLRHQTHFKSSVVRRHTGQLAAKLGAAVSAWLYTVDGWAAQRAGHTVCADKAHLHAIQPSHHVE